MRRFYFILCVFTVIAMYSCVEDADFDIQDSNSKLFFYCEFEQDEDMAFQYSTATGLGDLLEPINPTLTSDFDLTITENGETIEPAFRYNMLSGLFEAPARTVNSESGSFYTFTTSLKDYPQLKEIYGSTLIPNPEPLESLEILDLVKVGEESGILLDMTVRFAPKIDHRFYELEAFFKYSEEGIVYEKSVHLDLLRTYPGVLPMDHRNSLLIDTRDNMGQYISARIQASVADKLLDYSGSVYFRLKSVTSAHYHFHENMAKRNEANSAPLSEPVVYFTNIENGLGLISGYSSTLDSLSIK